MWYVITHHAKIIAPQNLLSPFIRPPPPAPRRPARTRTSRAGIIELTTSQRQSTAAPPQALAPLAPLVCLILHSHPRDLQGSLVLFWLLGPEKSLKVNFPLLILLGGWFFKSAFSPTAPLYQSKKCFRNGPPMPLPLPAASSFDASTSAVSSRRSNKKKQTPNLIIAKNSTHLKRLKSF